LSFPGSVSWACARNSAVTGCPGYAQESRPQGLKSWRRSATRLSKRFMTHLQRAIWAKNLTSPYLLDHLFPAHAGKDPCIPQDALVEPKKLRTCERPHLHRLLCGIRHTICEHMAILSTGLQHAESQDQDVDFRAFQLEPLTPLKLLVFPPQGEAHEGSWGGGAWQPWASR
jgi:hypothetical protein